MSAVSAQQSRASQIQSDAILRIAQQDAALAYGDLAHCRIVMQLAPDGWHVDYELPQPLMAGGGPHYVIDPATGVILSKRYEQ